MNIILPDNYDMVDIRPLGVLALDYDSNIASESEWNVTGILISITYTAASVGYGTLHLALVFCAVPFPNAHLHVAS